MAEPHFAILRSMRESRPSRRLPEGVAEVAAPQGWIVTRQQLYDVGIGREGVASRTRAGVWVDIGPRVVALQSGPLTRAQMRWVGVLHAGPGAVLVLATAAEANRLEGFSDEVVHVGVAHGREVDDIREGAVTVKVHQTRHVTEDLVALRVPTRQTLARSVLEMASLAPSDNRSRALIAASVQQGLTRTIDLDDFIARRRTLPKRRLLRETIADVAGGAHSLPEVEYAQALRRAGLPQPTRQAKVQRPGGGVWYLDNDFEEWAVTVEINGAQHYALLAREADDQRRFVHQVSGRLVVDVSSYTVRHQPEIAVLRTAEALISRGLVVNDTVAAGLRTLAERVQWSWTAPLRPPA